MNKKGGALSIILWIASVMVILFFLAGYLYAHNLFTNALLSAGATVDNNVVNLTSAVQNVVVPINSAMNSLHWISFILIACLAFSILIENFYIRRHPVLFFVHLIIVIVGVVVSIYVSNAYETLLASGTLASTLGGFTASSYVALYLPLWVALIGIFGLVLLVINANRDPELSVRGAGI